HLSRHQRHRGVPGSVPGLGVPPGAGGGHRGGDHGRAARGRGARGDRLRGADRAGQRAGARSGRGPPPGRCAARPRAAGDRPGAGRDAEQLLELLRSVSRGPVPQSLEYLVRDEQRRHGRVRISRATTVLSADAEVLDLLQVAPEAEALNLHRLAPTVAVTMSDPGFALQTARRAGLSPQAVGADGRAAGPELSHSLAGGPIDQDLLTADGPELRLPPAEAVARIRAAEEDGVDLSVTDRLLDAIAQGGE